MPSVSDRPPRELSRQALAKVVEARYDELFNLVAAELRRSGFDQLLAAGVVLTGGTSKMEGVVELAEEIFHVPVRTGAPYNITGLTDIVKNPIHSTGVGLLLSGLKQFQERDGMEPKVEHQQVHLMGKVKRWFKTNF